MHSVKNQGPSWSWSTADPRNNLQGGRWRPDGDARRGRGDTHPLRAHKVCPIAPSRAAAPRTPALSQSCVNPYPSQKNCIPGRTRLRSDGNERLCPDHSPGKPRGSESKSTHGCEGGVRGGPAKHRLHRRPKQIWLHASSVLQTQGEPVVYCNYSNGN